MGQDEAYDLSKAMEIAKMKEEFEEPSSETPPAETGDGGELPAVRPARRRAQVIKVAENDENPVSEEQNLPTPEPVAIPRAQAKVVPKPALKTLAPREDIRSPGEPPQFSGILDLQAIDLSAFEKALKKYKKSTKMKKLSTLDFLSTHFAEMMYFQVNEAGVLEGVLGYGNLNLVTQARTTELNPDALPSIFEILASNQAFFGSSASLREEDAQGLQSLGFQVTDNLAAIPILYKKAVTGLWLCTSSLDIEISDKDKKKLQKLFTDFVY